MVGNDSDANSSPSQNNNTNSVAEYLKRAAQAYAAGDMVLSLHLYLAAYERSLQDARGPNATVIGGLRQAWELAVSNKERSLAEYIFEKLEPHLSAEEVGQFAGKLQGLALEKLEEFGLSREDLEDMTEMISQDFFGIDPGALFMRIDRGIPTSNMFEAMQRGLVRGRSVSEKDSDVDVSGVSPAELQEFEVSSQAEGVSLDAVKDAEAHTSIKTSKIQGSAKHEDISKKSEQASSAEAGFDNGEIAQTSDDKGKKITKPAPVSPEMPAGFSGLIPADGTPGLFALPSIAPHAQEAHAVAVEKTTYRDLVGYEKAIETMHAHGIGIENDPKYKELVDILNHKHGLNRIPVTDSFLFRSPVREDANQFMLATMGEIDLPAIRMRMEENLQGMPVLCVMASADSQPRLNAARNAIEGRGILILEDIDLWGAPAPEVGGDDVGGFMYAQLSRGAREAMNLIRSAVENPDVFVLMSSSTDAEVDPFFYDLIEPLTVVDIEYPSASERADLWANIAQEHPSLKTIDRGALVKYSAHMSRYDMYMAAREAVEDAYKTSLGLKKYVPVTTANIFEKIAAFQPLDSDEYHQLENAVIDSFSSDLEKSIDDLLKGPSD